MRTETGQFLTKLVSVLFLFLLVSLAGTSSASAKMLSSSEAFKIQNCLAGALHKEIRESAGPSSDFLLVFSLESQSKQQNTVDLFEELRREYMKLAKSRKAMMPCEATVILESQPDGTVGAAFGGWRENTEHGRVLHCRIGTPQVRSGLIALSYSCSGDDYKNLVSTAGNWCVQALSFTAYVVLFKPTGGRYVHGEKIVTAEADMAQVCRPINKPIWADYRPNE